MRYVVFVLVFIGLISCKEEQLLLPKPRMYPKVTWPQRVEATFSNNDCGFSFKHPDYLQYQKDRPMPGSDVNNDCWFDLTSKDLNISLYFSYLSINQRGDFDKYIDDAFEMAGKHNIKASARSESLIEKPGVSGLLFEIAGPVAAPLQFYLTDSTRHFLRASLYFNAQVNPDSTQVVYDFIKNDIEAIIESFEWQS